MTTSSSAIPPSTVFLIGKSRSFKDALAGSSSSTQSIHFIHTSFKGCSTLLFDDSVVSQLAAPFALTHISIQLSNDLDYSHIFSRRAYYIQGCQMRLLKWTPDFDVHKESPIAHMHGHGLKECFRLHPHLRKAKESSKQEMDQIGVMKDIGEKDFMNIANEKGVTLEEGELPLEMEHIGASSYAP
ncbi:hypothetical protein M5K25_012732 [Dendrobium thyrsiflorum]|uniref:DUF4283 domain-containing protein n=1 Tax=Dendrobium thyrsiflorum TaxID=117978 RepID=A0ABD0UYA3_DENTH